MKIFIITGEQSGDQIAASIVEALRCRDLNLNIRGIGGENLQKMGLQESLFPLSDLSLMGVAEILPHIPKILNRMEQTIAAIKIFNPDIVLSVDAPDFALRVQERLKNINHKAKRIHVVAPSVWAWRPSRAKKIAKFLDGLLCLLPFEPPLFEKYGLKSAFMGHPVMNEGLLSAHGQAFRFRNLLPMDAPLCGFFFGSRTSELERHQNLFFDTAEILQKEIKDILFIAPTLKRFESSLRDAARERGLNLFVTSNAAEKFDAMKACDVALHVSGTIGLELSVADVPHVMAYKFQPLTYALAKLLVKSKFGHLTNIIVGGEIVPEFLQERATPQNLSAALLKLLKDKQEQQNQKEGFKILRKTLIADNTQKNSANKAAEFLESFIAQ